MVSIGIFVEDEYGKLCLVDWYIGARTVSFQTDIYPIRKTYLVVDGKYKYPLSDYRRVKMKVRKDGKVYKQWIW